MNYLKRFNENLEKLFEPINPNLLNSLEARAKILTEKDFYFLRSQVKIFSKYFNKEQEYIPENKKDFNIIFAIRGTGKLLTIEILQDDDDYYYVSINFVPDTNFKVPTLLFKCDGKEGISEYFKELEREVYSRI